MIRESRFMVKGISRKSKNPDFKYHLYDDKECEMFLAKYFTPKHVQTFNSIKSGAGKADFFRYCILYIKGGVYIDIDMRCIEPLFSWIQPHDTFVIPKDADNECVDLFQAFIASTPHNAILLLAIDKVIHHIEKRINCDNLMKLSGPSMFGICLNNYLGRPENTLFKEEDFSKDGQHIRILTHNIRHPREFITCGQKKVIKSQIWFRRKKTDMPTWYKTKRFC